ncbi:ABC transporter ATP-binding protein [Paracoccus luteus]|uniref:ABC transporter ATP-binding protein n=1 Tax=Paracoccus luteus TaxID=2508543 RepID=UPI00106F9A91|nr:ABC transporter ATP-binding protein [Paracoccus luteus]
MTDANLLRLKDISVRFGGLTALNGISLDLRRNASLGLLGPNGAGKTTLFNVIAGAVRPSTGRVTFDGRDVTGDATSARSRAGVARTFQITQPFISLTVRENVMVALTAAGMAMRQAHGAAAEYVDFVGLRAKIDDAASGLSTGQRKRLELARALATRPKLLLLDEVTGGVDRPSIPGLVETIRALHAERGLTMVVVEHHMDFLGALVDEALFLDQGEQLVSGSLAQVAADARVRDIYLGDAHV